MGTLKVKSNFKIKLICIALLVCLMGLTACSFEKTCKATDCEEVNLYQDGYCKYHYYINLGEDTLKSIVN